MFLGLDWNDLLEISLTIAGGAFATVRWVIPWFAQRKKEGRLARSLHPFYTASEIKSHTKYFIPTQCQSKSPSESNEINRDTEPREPLIPYFIRIFEKDKDDYVFMVLADSGMGKTTFMINLYYTYHRKWQKKYKIRLLPFNAGIDEELDKIPDELRRETILLLDGLDEDPQAIEHPNERIAALLKKISHFQTVVITCRTQFFAREEDIPTALPYGSMSPTRAQRRIVTRYISPLQQEEIKVFLRKKFGRFSIRYRNCLQFIEQYKELVARPMILNYIDFLVDKAPQYQYSYQVYAQIISRWLEREHNIRGKGPGFSENLYNFSRFFALDLYHHTEHLSIADLTALQKLSDQCQVGLDLFDMQAHSLLTRGAHNNYKFSHKSILEYFLALELFENPGFAKTFKGFEGMDMLRKFYQEMVLDKIAKPFFCEKFGLENGKQYSAEEVMRIKGCLGCGSMFLPIGSYEKAFFFNFSLDKLKDVTQIDLSNTDLQDFRIVACMPKLQQLNVANNPALCSFDYLFVGGLNRDLKEIQVQGTNIQAATLENGVAFVYG
ncbi:MAG TPA: leucine-rich repeat domain-containing protein [Haliscomenobacter sp.]|nr:leucine-rich repeat domain-containing protein [Haliscomenobacter sp.]